MWFYLIDRYWNHIGEAIIEMKGLAPQSLLSGLNEKTIKMLHSESNLNFLD